MKKFLQIEDDKLNDISIKFYLIATQVGKLAEMVSEIELSETDKKIPIEYMPRNIAANMLFLLEDYSREMSERVLEVIRKAGGNY